MDEFGMVTECVSRTGVGGAEWVWGRRVLDGSRMASRAVVGPEEGRRRLGGWVWVSLLPACWSQGGRGKLGGEIGGSLMSAGWRQGRGEVPGGRLASPEFHVVVGRDQGATGQGFSHWEAALRRIDLEGWAKRGRWRFKRRGRHLAILLHCWITCWQGLGSLGRWERPMSRR